MSAAPYTEQRRSLGDIFRNALIITRREVWDSLRDWRIIVPIVGLTFFFPFLAQASASWIASFLSQYGASFIGEQFIPLMLMIVGFFPISISLVIALETFVGEKERRSLEPLLSTPLSNTELYIGKTLAAMIPPLIASFGGMSVYLLMVYFGAAQWRPPIMVVIQMFTLTIVQALVMVTGAVVVSSQTTSTRAANLLASLIIIPMTLIINAEAIIIFVAPDAKSATGISALWLIALGMFVVTVLLLRVGNSIFNREELLGRMIDNLNLWVIFRDIWKWVLAIDATGNPAKNLWQWYRYAIPYSLKNIRTPLLVTIGVFVVYFLLGYWLGTLPFFQLPLGHVSTSISTSSINPTVEDLSFSWVLGNNLRVVVIVFFLSLISFGVAAYILIPPTIIFLGYFASQLIPAGLGTVFAAAFLPHGIIEIPTIILAAAAMFQAGAILTKPPKGKTVGQAWIESLGGTIKLGIGVILPCLIVAAFIESQITLGLVASVVGS
jgi:uncharacterized membrane protein SpoIIM required for sporulation/ABC-type transport system involved in multi-copper enzyme maturation permease subunit